RRWCAAPQPTRSTSCRRAACRGREVARCALSWGSDNRYTARRETPMNVQLPRPMDSAAFLAWAEGREGRYELANGRVTMMTGGSFGHALVVRGLFKALDSRLAGTD